MKLRNANLQIYDKKLFHISSLIIHLENVLKTSLQDVLKTSWRGLQNVLKTSWRCLEDVFARRLQDALARPHVLKTSWRRMSTYILVLIKTSWRCMTKANIFVLINRSWRRLEGFFWRRRRKTSWRRLQDFFIKTNVCWDKLKIHKRPEYLLLMARIIATLNEVNK